VTLLNLTLPNEEAMLDFGGKLAEHCSPPLNIFLHGQLGAGKTTFVRGFLKGLGHKGKVKSPSYNLVESYELGKKSIFHFDFYRIQDMHELDFIGIQDYWQPSSIFLIEWPEKGGTILPPVDLACHLEWAGLGRKLSIEAKSPAGEKVVSALME
jgi:tRNA threonylcarbamoyladenosine biosynthesis protein TsaE